MTSFRAHAAAALAAALCIASPAFADGLPIGWGWSTSTSDMTIQVEAFDVMESIEVNVRRHSDGRNFECRLGDMQLGDVEPCTLPAPDRTSEYTITIEGRFAGQPGSTEDVFEVPVSIGMEFEVDTDSFDADARRFVMTMNQPAGSVELTVRSDSGSVLAERVVEFDGEPAGTPLTVEWSQGPGTILTVDVKAVGVGGSWSSRQYIPWKVEFDAAHVSFASGSAEIPATDVPMLRERLAEIRETAAQVEDFVEVQLYVAGYTDTVGSSADNQRLSESRARAIAEFFREEGVRFEVFFQGFGESGLAVPTEDNVDEPQNRRSVFIMSTQRPPTSAQLPRTDWRPIP